MVDCLGYIIGSLLVSLTNSLPLILLGRIITGDFNAVGTNALLQTQIWIWNLESGIWIQIRSIIRSRTILQILNQKILC